MQFFIVLGRSEQHNNKGEHEHQHIQQKQSVVHLLCSDPLVVDDPLNTLLHVELQVIIISLHQVR